jgi:3-oxoacyl-[acyl-carrier-protein] synthase-3
LHFTQVAIQGIARIDAPDIVASRDLEGRFDDTLRRLGHRPGLIETLTGVVERRFFPSNVMPSDAATQAAEAAIAHAGIERDAIGVCVNTSVSKDFIEPSVASAVHGKLGLSPNCLNFDVGNACLAFLNAMELVSNMIERGQVDYALVVDGENSRPPVEATVERLAAPTTTEQDLRDNFATLTLGSGAAAMVLCRADLATTSHRFLGGVSLAATEHNHLCQGYPDRMKTDAVGLLKAGVALAERTWDAACRQLGWSAEDLDALIMHQVGSAHARTILNTLGLDEDRAHFTFANYGNIGPAAIPITLADAVDTGRIFAGDRVALMGIGSGLNCAMMEVRW